MTREQKDAEALRKSRKQAAQKKEKEDEAMKKHCQSTEDWISSLVLDHARNVPVISEKQITTRKTNAKSQANRKNSETDDQKKKRLEREAKAQALKRSLETEDQHKDRLIRQYERREKHSENEKRLANQRKRQQQIRDADTPEQRLLKILLKMNIKN